MSPSDAPAPFVLRAPSAPQAPLVFDSPHSAIEYPEDFAPIASREEICTTWDAFVDELFGFVPAAGATLLAACFPRAYIDANRAVSDLDPDLLETAWPTPIELSEHARRGMGLIRRFALPGVPMYHRKLSVAEVRKRIDRYYTPYRQALQSALDSAWRRHGVVYHFNCHSMKSRGNAMNRDDGAARPDLVISDRGGATAAPEFTAWVADYFTRLGYHVKINDPYRGADIIRTHGQPAQGRTSVQIELNRALYMNEATFQRGPGFAEVQADLTAFAHAMAQRTRQAVA